MYVVMKYTRAWSHRAMYSEDTAESSAPILLIFTKPLIPKVEGNRYERYFQKGAMDVPGHEIPERNSNGTEVKTKIIIQISLLRMSTEQVIAKKMQAKR